jgi:hypothetical protein
VIAGHVAGVPVEELAPFASGGAALLVARAWLNAFLRRTAR